MPTHFRPSEINVLVDYKLNLLLKVMKRMSMSIRCQSQVI